MTRNAANGILKSCRSKKGEQSKHSLRAPCKEFNQRHMKKETSLGCTPVKLTPSRGGSTASTPKQRIVRFSTEVEVETRYASEEDLKNSWFAGDDYVLFERDCGRTIAAIRKAYFLRQDGSPKYKLNAQEFTASGLEDMLTDELKRHRGFLKGRHHHHVLMEQHMQRVHGVIDPEQLQAISQLFSTESCHIALQRGTVKPY